MDPQITTPQAGTSRQEDLTFKVRLEELLQGGHTQRGRAGDSFVEVKCVARSGHSSAEETYRVLVIDREESHGVRYSVQTQFLMDAEGLPFHAFSVRHNSRIPGANIITSPIPQELRHDLATILGKFVVENWD